MNALLWWPGASVAVADVAAGLSYGLEANGVTLWHYRTDAHITAAGHMLTKLWNTVKNEAGVRKWTSADLLYEANKGVLERALRHRVTYGLDWVIAVSGMYQHPDFFLMLKDAGFKVCLVCTESPYDLAAELAIAPMVDVILTNERTTVPAFKSLNPRSYYLPHAYHPAVHTLGVTEQPTVPAHDVVFVGTGFVERVKLLEAIDWRGIDVGIYGVWQLVGPRSKLRRIAVEDDVPNARTAALYRAAKVGLNLHRTSVGFSRQTWHITRAESMNPRCYELAACGLFYTTDARVEVREVFGDALPTFTTPADCEAIIRRALAEPAWRADVVAACAERVQGHTWIARAAQMLDVLSDVAARAA